MTHPQGRDRRWLEAVFAEHHRAVLAYARRRVSPDDADDVVAEVFASAWQHRERVPEAALPWLYRAASNHVLHAHRSRGRSRRLSERIATEPHPVVRDHAEDVARTIDDTALVAAVLARLSALDAEVLRLSAWEQLTTDEIGYVLDCSPTAAKVRLHRARRRFAHALASSDPRRRLTTREATT